MFADGLKDSVAGAHVVHQEIAVRVQSNGAKRSGNREGSAVNLCSCGSSGQRLDVTGRTPNLVKQVETLPRRRAAGELRIARRRLGGTDETREMIDIGKTVRTGMVIGLWSAVAQIGDLSRLQPVGDAHLVEVCIGSERQQAGMLIFPTEA